MTTGSLDVKRQALLQRLQHQRGASGHELVALQLKACGISHVYGISGVPIDATLAACGKHGLRVIATRHQQASVLSAAAHNYFAGDLKAAVIVSSGPAVTNCATGILVASDNHWPLVVIGGRGSKASQGTGAFQDFDGAGFFRSMVKNSAVLTSAMAIARTITLSCKHSMEGQPGPCYIDISEDALQGESTWEPAPVPVQPPVPQVELQRIEQALRHARYPVLLIGDGLRFGDPWKALEVFVQRYQLPFITSPNAHGFLPDDHELNGTNLRGWLLGQADLVLMLGASLDWVFRHGAEIRPDTPIVRLGHGNDPVLQQRRSFLEFAGQPARLLAQLTEQLSGEELPAAKTAAFDEVLQTRSQDFRRRLKSATEDQTRPLTPACWLSEVAKALPDNVITVLDGNIIMAWAQLMLPVRLPVTRLTAGVNGCMGTGLPFAMGAAAAWPELPVVAVCGDFALGLAIMELETAVRHQLPIIILLGNNHGNGGRLRQSAFWPETYPERVCQFTEGVRYDQMMQAIGGDGIWIEKPEAIGPALHRALAGRRPTLIQVDIRDDIPLPDI